MIFHSTFTLKLRNFQTKKSCYEIQLETEVLVTLEQKQSCPTMQYGIQAEHQAKYFKKQG